jgi:DNA-binding transcriptional MerR regulator
MMKLNISQAAKAAGVTRATIHKHMRTGKLSAIVEDDGRRVIDVAELERVYGQLVSPDTVHTDSKNIHLDTPEVTSILRSQIERLEREIDVLRQERNTEKQGREREREEHRQERDKLHSIIEKQTLLLPRPQEETPPKKQKRWWHMS